MVKLKNKLTGTTMWVAEDRVEEYKAAGHTLAASSMPKKEPEAEEPAVKEKKYKK